MEPWNTQIKQCIMYLSLYNLAINCVNANTIRLQCPIWQSWGWGDGQLNWWCIVDLDLALDLLESRESSLEYYHYYQSILLIDFGSSCLMQLPLKKKTEKESNFTLDKSSRAFVDFVQFTWMFFYIKLPTSLSKFQNEYIYSLESISLVEKIDHISSSPA